MILSRLKASQVIDSVKSRLDDYHMDGFLSASFVSKFTDSKKRLIRSLNEADIGICSDLRPEARVIIFAPKGSNIIPLRATETYQNEIDTGIEGFTDEGSDERTILLNEKMYLEVRQIRSERLMGYSYFPMAPGGGGGIWELKSFSSFESGKSDGRGSIAYVDYKRSIIQLSASLSADTFFTFPAQIVPEKVDYEEFSGQVDVDDYKIATPEYAETLLILGTLHEMIPETNDLFGVISNRFDKEKLTVMDRMPRNQETTRVQGYIGGAEGFEW